MKIIIVVGLMSAVLMVLGVACYKYVYKERKPFHMNMTTLMCFLFVFGFMLGMLIN